MIHIFQFVDFVEKSDILNIMIEILCIDFFYFYL